MADVGEKLVVDECSSPPRIDMMYPKGDVGKGGMYRKDETKTASGTSDSRILKWDSSANRQQDNIAHQSSARSAQRLRCDLVKIEEDWRARL